MMRILALARISFLEGIRNRALFGILIFFLFLLALNLAAAGFFMRDIGKISVDMHLAGFSLSGLLLVLLVGVNQMGKDIEKKTIQLIFSKPISRFEYVLGKFWGIFSFVFVVLLGLLFLSLVSLYGMKLLYPESFEGVSFSLYLLAWGFVVLKSGLLISIVLLFSSVTETVFLTQILTIATYIVGMTIEEILHYLGSSSSGPVFSGAFEGLLHSVEVIFPNFALYDLQLEAAHGIAVPTGEIGAILLYTFLYGAIALLLAGFGFRRREFN